MTTMMIMMYLISSLLSCDVLFATIATPTDIITATIILLVFYDLMHFAIMYKEKKEKKGIYTTINL